MNDYEKGWVAALIDSEGCLSIKQGSKRQYRIIVGNTNLAILTKAQSLLGGTISPVSLGKYSTHQCFRLDIYTPNWKQWLADIPLIAKQSKRQEFLKWLYFGTR